MRISDWSSDVCSSDLFYLLPGDIRIDLRAAIDRSDNAPDAQPVLINAGLHPNGDMAARPAVTGDALTAARYAHLPPAPRGGRPTAVGHPCIATHHLPAYAPRHAETRRVGQHAGSPCSHA